MFSFRIDCQRFKVYEPLFTLICNITTHFASNLISMCHFSPEFFVANLNRTRFHTHDSQSFSNCIFSTYLPSIAISIVAFVPKVVLPTPTVYVFPLASLCPFQMFRFHVFCLRLSFSGPFVFNDISFHFNRPHSIYVCQYSHRFGPYQHA